ncbi:adaptor protein MecA [Lederbergia wuyishanensis]|uniref:Adapter protein MecA 1/2 n=1 Tax=Lederbergia wuyishanensis TaxID=1347903 RepID=A0ABU0D0Z9_9BACI|nr:adaptor protein MecA [Lederbergia wuyishanensis]MCJ8006697.1 adaptor protein MecA [Lederbergia wuyishanensis]MDQ0342079.1 adapter protein MecA 1/2 [Lederbergia wuyishanensis]
MKLERISANQIKYSISFEELSCKGFLQEEMVKDTFIWDSLFDEMLDEASRIYELDTYGAVSIDIYSLTSKELVLILTLDEEDVKDTPTENKKKHHSVNGHVIVAAFDEVENCISMAKRLSNLNAQLLHSSLFFFNSNYFLAINKEGIRQDTLYGICEEYGDLVNMPIVFLEDYGKLLIKDNAIQALNHYF